MTARNVRESPNRHFSDGVAGVRNVRAPFRGPDIRTDTQEDLRAEQQALLVRAADHEARRQAARDRGDTDAVRQHEAELRRLWARYVALDRSTEQPTPQEAYP